MGEPNIETCSTIEFFVNGVKVVDSHADPEWTLLYYLREKLHLHGTKLGCGEGGCGACTVMVSRFNRQTNRITHLAVNACLAPLCSVHGCAVTTVEGIGSTTTKLHPVQERIAKAHGSQCGFCTPGIVMSMYALLRTSPTPKMSDMEIAFQGNLCRCTGYRPIIEGFRSFTEEWEETQAAQQLGGHLNGTSNGSNGTCAMGDQCCKNKKARLDAPRAEDEILFSTNEFLPYDATQEPIFPPELQLSPRLDEQFLAVKGPRATWYRPTSLDDLLMLKSKFLTAKIINGNTEVGVEVKFKNFVYPVLIQPSQVVELNSITCTEYGLKVGSSVTLTDLEAALKREMSEKPEFKTRLFKSIIEMLHWFAGKQIRNVAAVGGNIMTGSPISDLNPIFMAANIELHVGSTHGQRVIHMNKDFFTGYRRNVIKPDELLTAIVIPYTKKDQYFCAYKQAKRRDDDIAIVNCAASVEFHSGTNKVRDFSIAFGGMAPTTVLALKTMKGMLGKTWDEKMLQEAYSMLIEDLPLSPSAPGGMIQYRQSLTLSFFFKFFLFVVDALDGHVGNVGPVPDTLKSASKGLVSHELKSSQYFQVVSKEQSKVDPVGRPLTHMSAMKQATGEAVYTDDLPHSDRELYMCLVTSTKAHARIIDIDPSAALSTPGVHAFFCHKDLEPDRNVTGPIFHDEQIFYSDVVTSQGQVIGAIIAKDQTTAQRAAKLVKIEYQELTPVIITIEDAIRANSFHDLGKKQIIRGDPEEAFKTADFVRSGEVRLGGQEHFYLETQCTLAVPKLEDDEMELFSSTQHAAEMQKHVAHTLGIPFNRVTVRVKRMGGGFGGKESRANAVALPCAFAAHKLGRPVRCMLDRDEDMLITGGRNPFLGKYRVGFTKEGLITVVEMDLYNNAGYSADLSGSVMDRAVFHYENSYHIPNCKITGYVCKTNLPTNTAFRGFGGPQGMFFADSMVLDIADALNKSPEEISLLNLYKDGDKTHYNQTLTYCTLQKCWEECLQRSEFEQRKAEVAAFNKTHRYKKRGLSIVPTKFGIAFTELFLNQSAALVHVYTDGSVLLTHGGTEMGQGLHTKMIQVASRVLGIPVTDIHISEMSTDKVPNTVATAASSGSDLNGMAVMNACQIIVDRLQPFKEANPKGGWKDWVLKAHMDRVSLSTTGFYKTPNIGYNYKDNQGVAFNYFTFGVAASLVEIDCLTGDHEVLRTDIVMDLGESLNPAIDIGQVEGAFVQGYGLFTLEELIYSPTGTMYTRGPGMYKIPGFADIPKEFNVSLLRGAPNPRAVYSSKAVGEPPLYLASSVFFAIKDAIKAARSEEGLTGTFRLDSPATAERIRMSCPDQLTRKFPAADPKTFTPWNIAP